MRLSVLYNQNGRIDAWRNAEKKPAGGSDSGESADNNQQSVQTTKTTDGAGTGLGGKSSGGGGGRFNADSDSLYAQEADLVGKITYTDPKFDSQLNAFKDKYEKNKEIYESIAQQTGLPPELIAAIHYRENTSMDFTKSIQNGADALPKGTSFVQDAINNINRKLTDFRTYQGRDRISYDLNTMLAFAEVWNGLQYYNDKLINPYLYSGTNLYAKGKYDYDGHYNSELVDAQPGLYLILKKLLG